MEMIRLPETVDTENFFLMRWVQKEKNIIKGIARAGNE